MNRLSLNAKAIYVAIIVTIRWTRAIRLASNKQYDEALSIIRRIEDGGFADKKIVLLKGWLEFATADFTNAVGTMTHAMELVSATSTLNDYEKSYLNCYASTWGLAALEFLGDDREGPFLVDFAWVELSQVQGILKREFPLRDHPEWTEP